MENVSKSRATTKKSAKRTAESPPINQMHANGRQQAHPLASSGRTFRVSLSTSALPSSPFLDPPVLVLTPPEAAFLSLRTPTSRRSA